MRNVHVAAAALGIWLCGASVAAPAAAAPAGVLVSPGGARDGAQTGVIRVGDWCRHCRDCDGPRAHYYAPRYEPSVVYYGPSGIYRPYPPAVVYQYPSYRPYYSPWRYARDYYYYRGW